MQLVPRQSANVADSPLSDLAEYVKCRCIQNIHMTENSILPITMLMGTQVIRMGAMVSILLARIHVNKIQILTI
jgi:hypothetical protein